MSRVTPEEVKKIISTDLDTCVVQVWIDGASAIVDQNADCINSDNLTQVELFLSAHFIGMLDPEIRGFVTKKKADVFDTTYSNPVALSEIIDSTTYGTTANMLAGGCLTSTTKATAKLFVLGC